MGVGFVVVIGVAVLAALGVLAVAGSSGGGRPDVRTFLADFRNGIRRRGDETGSAADDAPDPVDVSFDQFFAEAPRADDHGAYLRLDELEGVIERTGERAGRIREHLPHPRAASGAPAAARGTGAAVAPAAPSVKSAARRAGHVPVGTVPAPPAVPPQRGDG